jgi:uncharacterized membrane protein (DUF485 family)
MKKYNRSYDKLTKKDILFQLLITIIVLAFFCLFVYMIIKIKTN